MSDGVLQEQMSDGVLAGNSYAGPSGSEYYFDVVDSSAPTAPALSPAHASTGASKSSAIVFTFNEGIQVCVCVKMCCALWLWRIVNDKWCFGRLVQASLC